MKRRSFLTSLGASALLPAIPSPVLAAANTAAAKVVPVFSDHTYEWAKMIVRAHDKCNIGLLQRSLRVEPSVAEALKSALINNGVVQPHANVYGIHKATEPLYRNAFVSVSEVTDTLPKSASDSPRHATEKQALEDLEETHSDDDNDTAQDDEIAEVFYENEEAEEEATPINEAEA